MVRNLYEYKPDTVRIGSFRRGQYVVFLTVGVIELKEANEDAPEMKYQGYSYRVELVSLSIDELLSKIPSEYLLASSENEIAEIMQSFKKSDDLESWRSLRIKQIEAYDESDAVKMVSINGNVGRIEKDARMGLVNMYNLYESSEQWKASDVPPIWVGNVPVSIESPAQALDLLAQMEQYAFECFDATKRNLVFVQSTDDLDSLKSFDYKGNYPTPLSLEV